MGLSSLPLFDRLANARSVLLAGAGGGFDVYAALPLYFALRERGIDVHLASLSFASLRDVDARRPAAAVLEVTRDTTGPEYFPEAMLARWLASEGGVSDARVFAIEMGGVQRLRSAYEALCVDLALDAIVVVDGGTDSLVRGDEVGLGTPEADMASLVAVSGLEVATRLLVNVGFGVDSFHGVSHALVLDNIAAIDRAGGYLGAFAWTREMPEVRKYRDAVIAARDAMPENASIVHRAIVGAIEGGSGGSPWMSALSSLCWVFELPVVVAQIEFRELLERTDSLNDVSRVIESYQRGAGALREWRAIPI